MKIKEGTTMKAISYYDEIAQNYVNGNLEDFRKQLKKLSRKEILVLHGYFVSAIGFTWEHVNNILFKYL